MKSLLVFLFSLAVTYSYAQEIPRDLSFADFMKEIQISKMDGNDLKFVWWIPSQFWDVFAATNPTVKKSDMETVKEAFSGYTLIIAIDATKQDAATGMYQYASYDEMKDHLKIMDIVGNSYSPLADSEISNDMRMFRMQLSPALGNMMGELGKGAHIYFFKTQNSGGLNTTDALSSGTFKVMLDDRAFKWSLPLACLLPAKYCPVDEMKMAGDWLYCPYHGVKLGK